MRVIYFQIISFSSLYYIQANPEAYSHYLQWKTEPHLITRRFNELWLSGAMKRERWFCRVCDRVRQERQNARERNFTRAGIQPDRSCTTGFKLK